MVGENFEEPSGQLVPEVFDSCQHCSSFQVKDSIVLLSTGELAGVELGWDLAIIPENTESATQT